MIFIIIFLILVTTVALLFIGFAGRICGYFANRHLTREAIRADIKKHCKWFGFDISDEELDKLLDTAYEDAKKGEYIKSPVEEALEEGRRRAMEYAANKYWFDMFNKN